MALISVSRDEHHLGGSVSSHFDEICNMRTLQMTHDDGALNLPAHYKPAVWSNIFLQLKKQVTETNSMVQHTYFHTQSQSPFAALVLLVGKKGKNRDHKWKKIKNGDHN